MKILALDQARHGGWAVFDYEKKKLLQYGVWNFDNKNYEFPKAVAKIEALVDELIHTYGIGAVFIEDIQMRKNAQSFKALAQLQGVLVNLFVKNEYLYDIIPPSKWQNYCGARGRTEKERKEGLTAVTEGRASKILSLQYVANRYGLVTDNDNLSDAICLGSYAIDNITIRRNTK